MNDEVTVRALQESRRLLWAQWAQYDRAKQVEHAARARELAEALDAHMDRIGCPR